MLGSRSARTGLTSRRHGFLAAALLALAACSPAASDAGTRPAANETARIHSESGLAIVPVTVKSASGAHVFDAEVAATRSEQTRGLMFRTEMGANEAMIFPFEAPRQAGFWMKNTVIPLDIIFIGEDRRILNIAANTVPYSEESMLSEGIAIAVLELNGGRAAELGIAAGDKVDW
jgi:hypothetical protein